MSKLTVKERYGVTPNHILNDKNLSMKAKGLFGYMQSKPESWKFSVERIELQTKDGRDAIAAGLKELEKVGYLRRVKYKDEGGKWDWEYILTDKPFTENPSLVLPSTDNTEIYSKKDTVRKNSKKDFTISDEIENSTTKEDISNSLPKDDLSGITEYDVVPTNEEGEELTPRKKPQTWDVEKRVFATFVSKAKEYTGVEPEPAKLWQLKQIRAVLPKYSKQEILEIFDDWFNEAPDTVILNIHSALSAHNLNKYKMKK